MVRAPWRHGLSRVSVFTMPAGGETCRCCTCGFSCWRLSALAKMTCCFFIKFANTDLIQLLSQPIVNRGRSEQSAGLHQSTLTNCSSSLTMGCNGTQIPGVEAQQKVNMQNYTPSHYTHQQTSSFVTTYQNNIKTQSSVRNPYFKTRVFGTHPIIQNPYLKTPKTNESNQQITSISKPKELFQGNPWNIVSENCP